MTTPVVPPSISLLPDAPLVTDTPAEFDAKAFPFAEALSPFGQQANAQATANNTNAVAAKEGADTATSAASTAVSAKDTAVTAKNQVVAIDNYWQPLQLGPKSSPPTVDNQGNPLVVGSEYYDTTLKARYSWNGTAWAIGTNVTAGVSQVNGQTGIVTLEFVGPPDDAFDSSVLMADAPTNKLSVFASSTGSGADWPISLTDSWWNVFTYGDDTRLTQQAVQVLPGAGAMQSLTYARSKVGAAWSDWRLAGDQPVGTIYTGVDKPSDGTWLEMNAAYLQSSYPSLYAKLGLLNTGELSFTTAPFPFVDTTYSAKVFEASGGNLFAVGTKSGANALFAYSTNGGAAWLTPTGLPASGTSGSQAIAVAHIGSTTVLMFSFAGSMLMYRSTDGAGSWSSVTAPFSGGGSNLYALGSNFVLTGGNNVSKSATGATGSWTNYTNTVDGVTAAAPTVIKYSAHHNILLATLSNARLITSSDAVSWTTTRTVSENFGTSAGSAISFSNVVGIIVDGLNVGATVNIFEYTTDLANWKTVKIPASSFNVGGFGSSTLNEAFSENVLLQVSYNRTVMVLDQNGTPRFAKSTAPSSAAASTPIRLVGGKLRTEGVPSDFMIADPYSYNTSTQFLTPPISAPFGTTQWIKAS